MKLVIKVKPPKGRIAHRPTKVEPEQVRYDRKRAKEAVLKELKSADKNNTTKVRHDDQPIGT